jgi:hypothetical protein
VNLISSYGQMSSETNVFVSATNRITDESWLGAVVSDTAWGDIGTSSSYRYGSFFSDVQINLMVQNGATAFRIMLDKKPWDLNDDKNIYGLPYKDYIKQLVDDIHNRGIKVILDLTRDSSMGEDFDTSDAKTQVIQTLSLRRAWIDWGKEVVSHCKPDAIGIMNEPRGDATFDYYYDNFLVPSIDAYRSVDPNIKIIVMSMPFYMVEHFVNRPINDDNVLYQYHLYYRYPMTDAMSPFINACDAYGEGRLLEAKNYLYQYLDMKLSNIPKNRTILGEIGPYEFSDAIWDNGLPDPENTPNWDAFLRDMYNYTKDSGLKGAFQYAIAGYRYIMLDPQTDFTTFTPYGTVWVESCSK